MNGYSNGAHGVGADGWRGSNGTANTPSAGPEGPFPPYAEIVASATDRADQLKHHSVHIGKVLHVCASR
jgi:ubiquitin carboxyl-terminal hydrolase 8